MAIGNKKYCEAHYFDVIEYAKQNYNDLFENVWPPQKKKLREHINIGLEKHKSKSGRTEAWHGIQVFPDGTWRPKSFYGYSIDYTCSGIRGIIKREAAAGK